MSDAQDDLFQQYLNAAQITNTIRLIRFFLVSVLIVFMAFIVWDLAKKSKAGRFGSFILFFVLGLGVVAFIIKSVVIGLIESGAL